MEHNPIINSSDMQLAAEVAHESICIFRRYFLNGGLLTKEGKTLLLQLSDAAHNLPLMISPNNKSWRLDELHKDVANCRQLIQQINETEMLQREKTINKKDKANFVPVLTLWILLPLSAFAGIVFFEHYLDDVVPAEEIAQLSPEIKNKIKQEVKNCEKRGYAVTWINDPISKPYTRRDINNLKACLQHEAEGKDKIADDMNAYYEQKKALENQTNAAK
ncbi:MAG: hypothetical protein M1579_01350 [Gammaproteobacteria bacterium]|nr:hypothetical protein [Gammaproteobacteria bacterium]